MKQYITGEEINKLPFVKSENLRILLNMQDGVFAHKCNIGNMFEILNKDWFIELNPPGMDSQYNFELKIIERKDCKSENDYVHEEVFNANELSDVLFQAIASQCLNAEIEED
ncbi:hypothetical protein [Clostridium botulinum]|uniref:hypothetical protein n=1 Tax=Clostridium botulinum TaxID=1491 RepID=UPI000586320A|nr:hypothetical protein [Clostridium botulinum]AJE13470.1 hypothetical protein T259_3990 [Clostridium botulinum CDC_1436]